MAPRVCVLRAALLLLALCSSAAHAQAPSLTFDDALRLRSSINQITQENELIIRLQRQFNQERFQGLQTAMYIANRPNTHGGDLPSVDIQLAKPG